MLHWAELLRTIGNVCAFDYSYRMQGEKRPDPLPTLVAEHRVALDQARQSHTGPIILIGKSMGGRIGCHVALEETVAGVVCFGYPLCGAGDRTKLRAAVLRKLTTPILFLQGTRDSLCPLDMLATVRQEITAPNELYIVEGGDHSLLVTKSQLKNNGETQDAVDHRILQAIQQFVADRKGSLDH
jgi:predicted alpha/beta-hydrolase family hydrolase